MIDHRPKQIENELNKQKVDTHPTEKSFLTPPNPGGPFLFIQPTFLGGRNARDSYRFCGPEREYS